MAADDLNRLIDQAAEQLRSGGGDATSVESLRRQPALHEVVGKWPPDALLQATAAEIHQAIGDIAPVVRALTAIAPSGSVTAQFRDLYSRLQESAAWQFEGGPFGGAGNEGGGASEALPLGIVGRWPPD